MTGASVAIWEFRRAVSQCFPHQFIRFRCFRSDSVALDADFDECIIQTKHNFEFLNGQNISVKGRGFKLGKLVFTEDESCFHTMNLFVEVVFCNWAFEHQVWLHWFTQADLCSKFPFLCVRFGWEPKQLKRDAGSL